LIANSLTKYSVVLEPTVNRTQSVKSITINIKRNSGSFYLNADMNNIKINSFIVNDLGSVTNKLEIWNSQNYSEVIYYYLHPDGTYDTNNTNRIEPVKLSVISVDPRDDDQGERIPFAETAAEQAASEFENTEPVNNIELEVLRGDTLVQPEALSFGQTVVLIHDATMYTTILTGKRHSSIMTLMFGLTRNDLTKKIKMQTNSMSYSDKFINYRSATDTRTGSDTSIVGTRNYRALNNLPMINGGTIINNTSLSEIGISTVQNDEIEYLVTHDRLPD
jgi:hypothetical protein